MNPATASSTPVRDGHGPKHTDRVLARRIAAAHEEERQRLARDLHDGPGQLVTSLAIGIRALENVRTLSESRRRVRQLRRIVTRASEELEYLTRGMHPLVLQNRGLAAALRSILPEFTAIHGVRVRLVARDLEALRLKMSNQLALYRIVQEAMSNVAKHAGATRAEVIFRFRPPLLSLTVHDNGPGIDANHRRSSEVRLGWHSMRERAESLGGKVNINSVPGRGTTVTVTIPLVAATQKVTNGARR